tara:strand:- start:306157 stop:306282 length:126 start_codon:yes stop_codon:yes gene_type:complete
MGNRISPFRMNSALVTHRDKKVPDALAGPVKSGDGLYVISL